MMHSMNLKLISKAHLVGHGETSTGYELCVDAREDSIIEIPLEDYVCCVDDLCDPKTREKYQLPAPDQLHRMCLEMPYKNETEN